MKRTNTKKDPPKGLEVVGDVDRLWDVVEVRDEGDPPRREDEEGPLDLGVLFLFGGVRAWEGFSCEYS